MAVFLQLPAKEEVKSFIKKHLDSEFYKNENLMEIELDFKNKNLIFLDGQRKKTILQLHLLPTMV